MRRERRVPSAVAGLIFALGTSGPAHAAPVGAADYATAALALALILAGFLLVAWLVRRWLPGVGGQGVAKVVGAVAVGSRERVVVVEVADTWLVLGVGGGQVTALHTLARPAPPAPPGAPAP